MPGLPLPQVQVLRFGALPKREVAPFTALYDACVLYPAPLRDVLMPLALTDLYRAKWSPMIHDEWMRNLLRHRPDPTRERLERTRERMAAHTRDCLVIGCEDLIDALDLPDPGGGHAWPGGGDRHL